ncbi:MULTISPECIES: ribonuclease domain-containing protein [unclassified Paenibacillus]|uniref:ribonuclease domain-containing protein n=1 Tax=unclassified Paenibacillus TaxID=185978 RepID=UPI000955BE0C|nr:MULTISPECIES: ribonuclease domain-containing protein [unclassified Paenibacillus]ASS64963.1 ribonuclease [Paenibacillus sp. RUD330]SIQ99771.1 ribonuclease [Paenibacillus sp. RU4X]SIR34941.1 ribonuclease [Paenibacillus sp. RU4T]
MKSIVRLLASAALVLALLMGNVSPLIGQAVPVAEAAVSGPTDFAGIINYIKANGKLPANFLTKSQATSKGWVSSKCNLAAVAPGYSIGGDVFSNYEGLLPAKSGRTWREADAYYTSGCRNASRVLYSNDGLYYTTSDHYASFQKW